MSRTFYFTLGMLAIVVLVLGLDVINASATTPQAGGTDIVLTNSGCSSDTFSLAPNREPEIAVRNDAATQMVFTVPQLQSWISLAPGETGSMEVPRYIMGSYDSYCLTDEAHAQLGGNNPFLCVLQPDEIGPVALTIGRFTIAPHDRLKEVTERQQS